MKKTLMMFACVMLLFVSTAQAKDYVIVLSPMQSHKSLERQTAAVIRFLVETVRPGEKALIIDGLRLKVITQFSVKDKKVYDNPKAKVQLNRKAIAALRHFGTQPMTIVEHEQAAVMQVPQLLKFLGRNYGAFEDTDIIILGSPIYVDAHNPDWGMINNQYPGDGHFSAAPQDSPFSLRGNAELLTNTRIHWVYPDDDWISSDAYRVKVTRFWHLLVEGYGAQLSTFTGDMTTLWYRAAQGAKAPPHGYKIQETDKLETIQFIDTPQNKKRTSIYERELSDVPPSKQVLRQAQNVEIGISWDCEHCDLDLYVRAHHGTEVLYFNHRRTAEGYYHKDFMHSPKTDGGYETVTMTAAIDLRDVLIAINWYGGHSPNGVTGEIRLSISDQTYGLPFTFSGTSGNGGSGKDKTLTTNQTANTNWLIINPKDVVGL